MAGTLHELGGRRVHLVDEVGPPLRGDRDALALVSDSYAHQPDWVALPVSRCGEAFFELRTRILGDVAPFVAGSRALRDFVRESNRGGQIWFVANLAELRERLEAQG